MILYVDASALVKRYLLERGSRETRALTERAELVATSLITRAEVAAALAKAARAGLVTDRVARAAQHACDEEWADLVRLPVTEGLVEQAQALAWAHGLRGYDAAHLSAALRWQESVGVPIVVATFDRQLWEAAQASGVTAWPEPLPR